MKNRNGFTLVELLVVIVILGIVTGLSIPLIRNIQEDNKDKEYKTYMNTMRYSTRLYVDSYGEDLFGRHKSGCVNVSYFDLYQKGLIKDIPIDNVSCATDNTFVRVVKLDGKYGYSTSIGCGNVINNNVNINTSISNVIGTLDDDVCRYDAAMKISSSPVPDKKNNYKKRNIKVNIQSMTGVNNNAVIYYGFSYDRNTNVINNDWKKLNINIPGKKKQKEDIYGGKVISIESSDIVTPAGITGDLYLVLRIDKLENLAEEEWTPEKAEDGNVMYFGEYRVDNIKPQFNDSTIISSEDGFNSIKPKLNLKATDNFSNTNELSMCISYDEDTCSLKVSDMKNKVSVNNYINNTKYESYNANKVLSEIKNTYDSTTHTIYVVVSDAAGNYVKTHYTYRIARRWTLTYNAQGGNECNPSSKSFIFNDWEKNLTWGDLCDTARTSYIFTGWNTAADGSGSEVTKDTPVNSDLTIYAQWYLPAVYLGHVYSSKNDPCGIPTVVAIDSVNGVGRSHMNSCGLVVSANRFTHPPKNYTGYGILTPWQDRWGIYANEPNIYYSNNAPTSDVSQMIPLSVREWHRSAKVNMYIYRIERVPTPPGMEFVGEVHTITTYINHGNWAQWSSGIMAIDKISNKKDTLWGCYVASPLPRGVNYTGFGVILTGGVRSYDAKCGLGNYKIYPTADNMYYSPVATSFESELSPLTSSGVVWGHKDNKKYYIYRKK